MYFKATSEKQKQGLVRAWHEKTAEILAMLQKRVKEKEDEPPYVP